MDFYLILPALFAFGAIAGSFLNVVILRFDTGMPIAKGRSKCFSCGKTLRWYELVPIASFLAQRGRCRSCQSRISWQYPLVELATAAAFPIAYLYPPFAATAALLCLYIVIFVYDLRHRIIPDEFSYGAGLVSLAAIGWTAWGTGEIDLYRVIAGPILFLFFYFFWVISGGRWMGLGDAKLALSVGWFLGLSAGVSAILLAFWIGAAFSLSVMALQKTGIVKGSLGMRSEIPFGPFILIGFLTSLLFGIDFETLSAFLAIERLAV